MVAVAVSLLLPAASSFLVDPDLPCRQHHLPERRQQQQKPEFHLVADRDSDTSRRVGSFALAALVALSSVNPALALPPVNCNSFGCYPAETNPGGAVRVAPTAAVRPSVLDMPSASPPPPPAASPPTVTTESSPRALKVAKALRRKKATMYGAFWCGFCNKERQALGQQGVELVE